MLWQFVSINGLSIAATVSSFDPSSLMRFPLRFGRYLVLRTLLGLMTPSTIVGCLALLAAAIGIGIAKPALALPALIVLAVYALMNVFLTRMIGAWMERWLANRRFREIFGVLMALFAVGIQFLNFQRAPVQRIGAQNSWLLRLFSAQGSRPALAAARLRRQCDSSRIASLSRRWRNSLRCWRPPRCSRQSSLSGCTSSFSANI